MGTHAIHGTARPALEPSTAAFIAAFVAQERPLISQRSVADARSLFAGEQAGTVEKLGYYAACLNRSRLGRA